MRKLPTIVIVISFIAAACGGGSDEADPTVEPSAESVTTQPPATEPATTEPPTTEPPTTEPSATAPPTTVAPMLASFSDDGDLGVATDDPSVTVRLLDPADWPPELAGADVSASGVKLYELEPDGATFDEPVTVQRRLDISSFESLDLGPGDVPLVTMLTQNSSGEYELLDDLTIMRVGPHLFVSGTTDHFSPIIIANENRMIPWVPDGDGNSLDPGALTDLSVLDAILSDPGPLGPVDDSDQPLWIDVPHGESLSGVELPEAIRRMIAENAEARNDAYLLPDDDGAPVPSEPAPVIPGPTLEGASGRAQRFGTSFPAVPIALAPSAQSLLDDPEALLDVTVMALELVLTEEEYLSLTVQVSNDLADELGPLAFGVTRTQFQSEVFHRAFGFYPSEILLNFFDVVVSDTQTLYGFSWQGDDPANGPPIIDIREAVMTPEGPSVNLGLECFCDYQHGLIVVEGELDPELLDRANAQQLWEFIANDPNAAAAVLTNEAGALFESSITADEGTLFQGFIHLQPMIIEVPSL